MDTARYIVALITIVSLPPAIVHWLVVHPFVGFWRRLGPGLSFALLLPLMVVVGVGMYLIRRPLLAVDFGTNYALLPPAVALYLAAMVLSIAVRRHLTFKMFVGLPEIAPTKEQPKLLTEGVYGRVRHPRYVAVMLGLAGAALFVNFLVVYLSVPLSALALYAIVRLEERELVERFGAAYEAYRERVPMFVPRFG